MKRPNHDRFSWMKLRRAGFVLFLFWAGESYGLAHSAGTAGGFGDGLTHPVLGLDHLLAMVSVGMLSAQMGGRAIWTVPATFVGVMLVGGVVGMMGIPFFSVERGIACSVLLLGIAIAAKKKLPVWAAMIGVGFFALFHGYAHGVEMPSAARPIFYALGFMSGTTLIHLLGVAIGLLARRVPAGESLLRSGGGGIAATGLYLLLT